MTLGLACRHYDKFGEAVPSVRCTTSRTDFKKSPAAKDGTTLLGTKVAGMAYALTTGCPPPVDIRGMAAPAHPRAGAASLLGTMLAATDHLNAVPVRLGTIPRWTALALPRAGTVSLAAGNCLSDIAAL